ncbi:MAG: SpoIIE family protein phosphatase [Acidobacteriota bacterium]|nr:SpoIIE family protein phosphatase [Acidobacteriota bacterium]
MRKTSVQLDDRAVPYFVCDDCRILLVEGEVTTNLSQDHPIQRGDASDRPCPDCDDVVLEATKGLPGEALSCRRCGLLEVTLGENWPCDEANGPLAELLNAAALVMQTERNRKQKVQLPGAFHVEASGATDFKCPCCEKALTRYKVFDKNKSAPADFEICDRCFGIWLDREDHLARSQDKQTVQLTVDFESIQPAARACPKCRDINLVAMRFRQPDTEIDCCPDCNGTWLDGGELQEFCDHLGGEDHDVIDALVDNAVFQDPALCKTLRHFSRTLHQLDSRVQEQERHLEQARDIQAQLLFAGKEPETMAPTNYGDYQVVRFWQPARTVGGDYFDLIELTIEGRPCLGICIADVSGKGLPASLLMANFQALLRAFAPNMHSPAALCAKLGSVLYHNTTSNKYITAVYGILDLEQHRFTFTNAGHNQPVYSTAQGGSLLATSGTVLGLFPEWQYTEQVIDLAPSDRIFFYTDGVSEVENPEEEDFGEERLLNLVQEYRKHDLLKAQQLLVREVKEFCRGNFLDDATALFLARA